MDLIILRNGNHIKIKYENIYRKQNMSNNNKIRRKNCPCLRWSDKDRSMDVTRTLIGGAGCIFIYSCSARRVSFQIDQLIQ